MDGKTIVITGASDGIGAAAARELKRRGENVVICGRNREKTERIAAELGAPCHLADYSRLSEVKRLAEELKEYDRIDVLCNNAGGVLGDRAVTEDGFEKTFQVNVLGGFLLTRLLFGKLAESNATVIQTSSIAANLFGSDFRADDLQNEKNYSAVKAYGYGKLCDALLTRELAKRYGDKINAVAFEPGVVRTNFAAEGKGFIKFCYHTPLKYFFTITPKKSAERLVKLALGEAGKDFVTGETYGKKKPMKFKFKDEGGEAAKTLFDECVRLTDRFIV
ncbi:MAG TPA: short-chain dehydrogenase [Clostridiales bacterium]|nr:short-chain dehydrogenase [Clostridiales bacterium]